MKVLLFGATGSAGGSVLRVCLAAPVVEEVRAIVRRPLNLEHDKLRVIVHGNYLDYASVEDAFQGVNGLGADARALRRGARIAAGAGRRKRCGERT